MRNKRKLLFTLLLLFGLTACREVAENQVAEPVDPSANFEVEKKAILETLNNETRAAFQRDYDSWQEKWVHDPKISKTYINFEEGSFSESLGWDEISNFVKTFIEQHPEPEPVPALIDDIEVRLYKNGAWVSYQQQDSLRGLKRETRLMEKVNGQWKIAGMHTTIYGPEREE